MKKLKLISKPKSTLKMDRPVIIDGDLFVAKEGQSGNRVFIGFGKTINIGNYESIRVEFGRGSTVSDGQDVNKVKSHILTEVVDGIKEIIKIAEDTLK